MRLATVIALLLAAHSLWGQQPPHDGITGEMALGADGFVWMRFADKWEPVNNERGGRATCLDVPLNLRPFAGCAETSCGQGFECGPNCITWDATSTLTAATIRTCDDLQPPSGDDWTEYERAVKGCRGELMAEYVLRAAREMVGDRDWCGKPTPDVNGMVSWACSELTQRFIDARAEELLKQDKELLRRLLRLLAAGVNQ